MAQRIVNGKPVQTQRDERGLDYFINAQGKREYLYPAASQQVRRDKPKDTQFTIQDWDASTGTFKPRRNWDGIGTLAGSLTAGGLIAAPAIGAAFSGPASGAVASGAGSPSLSSLYSAAPAITSQGVSHAAAGGVGMKAAKWLDAAIFGGDLSGKILGAKQQANATDRAAEAQLQANREALAFLKQQWETARADFQPYLNLGHASAGRLNEYVTNTPSPTMPANLRQQMEGGYDPQTYTPRSNWTPPATTTAPRSLAQFNQPGGVIDLSKQPDGVFTAQPVPKPQGSVASLADFGRPPMMPPQMVLLEAPTGERKAVPVNRVNAYLARGAKRVA